MSGWIYELKKMIIRGTLSCLLKVIPTSPIAVVVGWPDTEGNSVEVLRHLITNYQGRIIWLITEAKEELIWQIRDVPGYERVECVGKNTKHALILYLRAKMVFFTHGLYSSPKPGSRRVYVNLWHGDGPKRTENKAYLAKVASTWVVGGTRLWGEYKSRYFGLEPWRAAIVGNPRIDQFDRPATDADLCRLNIDPSKKFILWLPTYRQVRNDLTHNWSDSKTLSSQEAIRQALTLLVNEGHRRDIQIIFKPHPMEADRYLSTTVQMLTDAQLIEARVPFYSFLARATALITDYSSVWTDFLGLRRPIGFFCPDMEQYERERGFNVDRLGDLIPGPLLQTDTAIVAFLDDVAGGHLNHALWAACVERIGAVTQTGATSRLFDAIRSCQSHHV